ncbi:TIGR03086 family protein [Prauserella muralis]|uniref:TIGR03086 family protein n=1 Tax=Prauserella muralis TaxID=588067 RepID=A0A2V4BBT1_9PSEU|nr:TIGR03086 family protein [Prauserella muralis]TWE23783.1 uncharacterized protein (TIGR03086 family) [Prauserella muralis]
MLVLTIGWETLLGLHERAVRETIELVRRVRPEDLDRPTPCTEWTLDELVSHMTTQHYGFAAAARGHGDIDAVWRQPPPGEDHAAEYARAAEDVLAAFAAPGVSGSEFALAEFGAGVTAPAPFAVSAHFVDYVVHGWDVARSLGLPFAPDGDIAEAALRVAEQVPDGPERKEQGAFFGPALPGSGATDSFERTLLLLGRSPTWPG